MKDACKIKLGPVDKSSVNVTFHPETLKWHVGSNQFETHGLFNFKKKSYKDFETIKYTMVHK